MSISYKVPGSVITGLATVALVAPAAGAMPIHEPSEFDAGHASVAQAAQQRQDLRSADAKDAVMHPKRYVAPAAGSKSLPGAPTWASNPQPVRAVQAPADSNDDGFPWAIVLGAAGIGLIGGGAAVGATRSSGKRTRRARVAA
jgi:hypothetical protein